MQKGKCELLTLVLLSYMLKKYQIAVGEETGKTRLQSVRLMDALLCLWFEFLERPECHRNPSRLEPFRRQWVACNSNNWYTNNFLKRCLPLAIYLEYSRFAPVSFLTWSYIPERVTKASLFSSGTVYSMFSRSSGCSA